MISSDIMPIDQHTIDDTADDTYDYTFMIFDEDHLAVAISEADGDNPVDLVITTDYTVTGVDEAAGGTIVLTATGKAKQTVGYTITISRVIPITQETDYANLGAFLAETHERSFDLLTMMVQQHAEQLYRCLKVSKESGDAGTEYAQAMTTMMDACVDAKDDAETAKEAAELAVASVTVPLITASDAYKTLRVNAARTAYELVAQAITKDGAVAYGANQSMGGYKLTNLGAPTALSADAARISDVEAAATAAAGALAATAPYYAKISDTRADGVAPDVPTRAAWTKKTLQTEDSDEHDIVAIASSVITLAAGTYHVRAEVPADYAGSSKLRLRNTTASETTLTGINGYTNTSHILAANLVLSGRFTIGVESNFELQYYMTAATGIFPPACSMGEPEVYAVMEITKINE